MTMAASDPKSRELIQTVSQISNGLMGEVAKVIIGKQENLRRVTIGILSNANMLIEDFPGLAKTLMANTFATSLGCKFKRVQFTPDLLPADIMGTYMYDQQAGEFKLRPGPLFTNVLLADEINRAPPKTQAALLEAMEEKQVTIEGITHKLPAPFITMATQNPIEQITSPKKVVAMQKALETVHVDTAILSYIVELVHRTREDHRVITGASPRASQSLFKTARASAAIDGRDYVIPDDIKAVALQVVSHRILLKPESKIRGVTGQHIMRKILSEVPVPVIQ